MYLEVIRRKNKLLLNAHDAIVEKLLSLLKEKFGIEVEKNSESVCG